MVELTKATGETLLCDSVVKGQQYPFLYIHTSALSWANALAFFSDEVGLAEIRVVNSFTVPTDRGEVEAQSSRVYRGWTVLYSIQRDPLVDAPDALMIWLQRPEEG